MGDMQGTTYPCGECQAGVLSLRYVTYVTWLGEEMITVPNFPAWVCDVCGRREYDTRAISWLDTLLSPHAGRSTQPRRRRSHPHDGSAPSSRPSTTE